MRSSFLSSKVNKIHLKKTILTKNNMNNAHYDLRKSITCADRGNIIEMFTLQLY